MHYFAVTHWRGVEFVLVGSDMSIVAIAVEVETYTKQNDSYVPGPRSILGTSLWAVGHTGSFN